MKQHTLYLMLGYPGAGKTTVAKLIAEKTGAVHLWADDERHHMFAMPTHSHEENLKLYGTMNDRADELLGEGKSVVFDTSFNLYKDREHLRGIAAKHKAKVSLVWIATPLELARDRAVHAKIIRNGYEFAMSAEEFESIANKLESPRENEKVIKIDGTKLDEAELMRLLS